ncbi:Peptidoglycan N-acetylglucosamine deacetylase [Liberibacter crescens BT-1]|uniref:Chitooligosaccharide deacetylase n=1 Tax=Liberibacter crescens (strain BT-1) TaxID=1215343 RepID=L0EWJ1_LIBCB|nr:polysaccharide deacetylase family protein [Liberibacter crescens]AGA65220.1 Peptidoglycan N-acetylglucosamine deacetylase [Liberibacter crescens BT-1]AMC13171.1 hypothetical protein RL73_06220 [Liberibacter crescens]
MFVIKRVYSGKKIHLSFDDGPHSRNTKIILDILERNNINATFFVIGEKIKRNKDIIAMIYSGGHRIGCHLFQHYDMTTLSDRSIRNQIQMFENALSPFAPIDRILRPPYGAHSKRTDRILHSMGYHILFWNVDTEDWKRHQGWVDFGMRQIRNLNECLVLMHDIHYTTANQLEKFIKEIKEIGDASFVDLEAITGIPKPNTITKI